MDPTHREPALTARPPATTLAPCVWCAGQRSILEPSVLGLIPVVCGRCDGHGRERPPGAEHRL